MFLTVLGTAPLGTTKSGNTPFFTTSFKILIFRFKSLFCSGIGEEIVRELVFPFLLRMTETPQITLISLTGLLKI